MKSSTRQKIALAIQVLTIVVFLSYFYVINTQPKKLDLFKDSAIYYLIPLIGVLSIIIPLMASYLGDRNSESGEPNLKEKLIKLQSKLKQLEDERLTIEVKNGQNDSNVIENADVIGDFEIIEEMLYDIEINIKRYIDKLSKNSNLNLIIGVVGTFVAISVLSQTLLYHDSYTDVQAFLLNFIPKFSFVIFIQLFAFFFLRLYKSNLEDAKYFQNELTNMLAKSSAIRIASFVDNKDLLNTLVLDLSNTERNFKLAVGESLMNIEKAKIEKDLDLESYRIFKEFLQFKQAKKSK